MIEVDTDDWSIIPDGKLASFGCVELSDSICNRDVSSSAGNADSKSGCLGFWVSGTGSTTVVCVIGAGSGDCGNSSENAPKGRFSTFVSGKKGDYGAELAIGGVGRPAQLPIGDGETGAAVGTGAGAGVGAITGFGGVNTGAGAGVGVTTGVIGID